jgi:hypothetical protein
VATETPAASNSGNPYQVTNEPAPPGHTSLDAAL